MANQEEPALPAPLLLSQAVDLASLLTTAPGPTPAGGADDGG